mmetsp:Transcript_3564/g.2594  ORF Transcript_3564/g.2594 Transcript_3564/m.2594 type:complete len:85 (+) Transcript_3564:1853-2107(+)
MTALNSKNLCLAPWCEHQWCELTVKEKSKEESLKMAQANEDEMQLTGAAKTLCIPFEQEPLAEGTKCFHCEKPATTRALFGRSY